MASGLILLLTEQLDDTASDARLFTGLLVVAHDRAHLAAVTQELAQLGAQRVFQVRQQLAGPLLFGRTI